MYSYTDNHKQEKQRATSVLAFQTGTMLTKSNIFLGLPGRNHARGEQHLSWTTRQEPCSRRATSVLAYQAGTMLVKSNICPGIRPSSQMCTMTIYRSTRPTNMRT